MLPHDSAERPLGHLGAAGQRGDRFKMTRGRLQELANPRNDLLAWYFPPTSCHLAVE